MTRYFYTCHLSAAFMAKWYGMRYSNRLALNYEHVSGDTVEDWSNQGPYYIHPDSLPLLEPMVGDLIYMETPMKREWIHVERHDLQKDLRGYRIIQRQGRAFIWPEQEQSHE